MIRFSPLAVVLAGAALVAACAAPTSPLKAESPKPGWQDAGTPNLPVSIDRLARYYVDENGTLWDDHGRKYEPSP